MPANALGVIQILTDVVAQEVYHFSTRDSIAVLRKIPNGSVGTRLVLPDSPSDGDFYEFIDIDGSCSPTAPIAVVPSGAAFITGISTFVNPNAWARFTFDEATQTWFPYSPNTFTISPSTAWVDQTLAAGIPVVATAAPGTRVLQATITPRTSGLLRVFGLLSATNAQPANDAITLCISHGTNPTAADFVGARSPLVGAQARTGTTSILFYYPAAFQRGTPVQINLGAFASNSNSFVVQQHDAQFEVQEIT